LTIKPYGVASNLPPASQIALESHLPCARIVFDCRMINGYDVNAV
jgi:hypothetical protein